MDRFDLEPNFVSDFSFYEELQEGSCAPTSDPANLRMIRSGHSVQILDPPHCDQLSHVISPAPGFPHALSDYAIHYLSPFENIFTHPYSISQKDLDDIVPVDGTEKDLATTSWQQPTHTFTTEQSSRTVTGPLSVSVAEACPLAEYKQQPLHTEPAKLTPSHSPDDSLTITTSQVCKRAYLKGYHKAYHKVLRAELNLSDDTVKAKLAASVAGKAAGNAEIERVKGTLVRISSGLRTITPESAYNRAYVKAYRAEIKLSGDKVRARRAGQVAGKAASKAERERRQSVSASRPSPPPDPRSWYQKAYHKACRVEMQLSGDKDKAKKAGQAAGRAASDAANKAIAERVEKFSSLARPT